MLADYSPLLLHIARSLGGDQDTAMDRYTFILDALRRDDYRRLRSYVADGRASFHSWLAVVAGRICLDEYRHRYGRLQGDGRVASEQHARRRTLADLAASDLGLEDVPAATDEAPDRTLERSERRAAIDRALADLDASDRLLLRLRFEEDLSVPEIARLLGQDSPFRLYRRLEKVLGTVRRALEAGGVRDATT
jgi:RNA polymerase sigma factor (sigma-70 family)